MSALRPLVALIAMPSISVPAWECAIAQELEPRAYANAPVGLNFVIGGYAHTQGDVIVDPAITLDNADVEIDALVLGYARSFGLLARSAKFDVTVPYASLDGTADFRGTHHERSVDGFGDPRVHFSVNIHGAPALSMSEMSSYRQKLIVGLSLSAWIPIGRYESDRLINIGTNRWALKPEIGISQAVGRWILEAAGAVPLYADNDRFLGARQRSQDPVYSIQGGAIRTFPSGIWLALFGTYYTGGRTRIDGISRRELQENSRLGLTLSLPVDRRNSIKLYANTGVSTRTGTDFDAIGMAWQHRWGGGL